MFDYRSKYGQNAGPQWIKIPISKMKDNNKLIAEFMGDTFYPEPQHWYDSHGSFIGDTLKYHTSWDWLMPVIEKCYQFSGRNRPQWIKIPISPCRVPQAYHRPLSHLSVPAGRAEPT